MEHCGLWQQRCLWIVLFTVDWTSGWRNTVASPFFAVPRSNGKLNEHYNSTVDHQLCIGIFGMYQCSYHTSKRYSSLESALYRSNVTWVVHSPPGRGVILDHLVHSLADSQICRPEDLQTLLNHSLNISINYESHSTDHQPFPFHDQNTTCHSRYVVINSITQSLRWTFKTW